MKEKFQQLKLRILEELNSVSRLDDLEKLTIKYLGRRAGELTVILRNLKNLPLTERKETGKLVNKIKEEIEKVFKEKEKNLKATIKEEFFDYTLPGKKADQGSLNPLTQFLNKVIKIFFTMGFEVVQGQEVESEEYNFDLLNIPKDHPARDLWDTFYLTGGLLLRTHTSPMQLRLMEKRKPPVRLIVPGRVFRHEAIDASHESVFYQCEGLVIDEGLSLAHLIGTLKVFLEAVFGEIKIRARPSFFPFVEPGIEVDMSCLICKGKGCSVCKQSGWIEMLGAGMIHPEVLKNMKVDIKKYSGFAFGLGIDRLTMLYHGIDDIRLFHAGDLKFIKQF